MRPEQLRAAEDALFSEWRRALPLGHPGIVPDGVAVPSKYLAAPRRVMFLLKEPFTPHADWDLRDEAPTGFGSWRTWSNAARWCAVAKSGPDPPAWEQLDQLNQAARQDVLTCVALVNVKKSPGRARAVAREVHGFAAEHRSWLRRQFAIYQPTITLLAGTAAFLGDLFDDREQGERVEVGGGRPYRVVDGLGVAIRMPHPQASVRKREMYDALRVTLAEAVERGDV